MKIIDSSLYFFLKHCDREEILEDIRRRDAYDTTREIAPLVMARDALLLDTSSLSLEETIDKVEEIIKNVS